MLVRPLAGSSGWRRWAMTMKRCSRRGAFRVAAGDRLGVQVSHAPPEQRLSGHHERVKVYVWNERNPGSVTENTASEPMELEAVPREGDTVAVREQVCARVTRVHWDLVTGVVHVYAR